MSPDRFAAVALALTLGLAPGFCAEEGATGGPEVGPWEVLRDAPEHPGRVWVSGGKIVVATRPPGGLTRVYSADLGEEAPRFHALHRHRLDLEGIHVGGNRVVLAHRLHGLTPVDEREYLLTDLLPTPESEYRPSAALRGLSRVLAVSRLGLFGWRHADDQAVWIRGERPATYAGVPVLSHLPRWEWDGVAVEDALADDARAWLLGRRGRRWFLARLEADGEEGASVREYVVEASGRRLRLAGSAGAPCLVGGPRGLRYDPGEDGFLADGPPEPRREEERFWDGASGEALRRSEGRVERWDPEASGWTTVTSLPERCLGLSAWAGTLVGLFGAPRQARMLRLRQGVVRKGRVAGRRRLFELLHARNP